MSSDNTYGPAVSALGQVQVLQEKLAAAHAIIAAVSKQVEDWNDFAGPGSFAENVCGQQVVSVEHITKTFREILGTTKDSSDA